MPTPLVRRPGAWRKLLAVFASAGLAAAGLSLIVAGPASAAPAITITVDTLAFNAQTLPASANPSGCVDKETPAKCSLAAALAYANAIPSGSGDIEINFDSALSGLITDSAANTGQMAPNASGANDLNGGYWGSDFVVNAANPVTIDFGGTVGFVSTTDLPYNAFDIKSDNVTIKNFTNVIAAEAAFLIRGVSGTTISNGICDQFEDTAGNNTINLETCISIDPGTAVTENTTVKNFAMGDPYRAGIATDTNAKLDGLTLTNVSMVNDLGAPHFLQLGYNSTNSDIAMTGVSDTVPTGKPASGYVVYPRAGGTTIDGFSIDQSTFTGMRGGIINEPGAGTITDLSVTNTVFNKVGQVWDDPVGTIKNMTWTGNTFENGTTNSPYWQGEFHMDEGKYVNANISNNQFLDNTHTNSGDIMFQQPGGSGNVIANNTFTRSGNTYQYQDAIRNYISVAATTDTGWSIKNNDFDGYGQLNNAHAPIWHLGSGIMKITGNTFSPNTNGTTVATESEGGVKWFVANEGGGANNNIQTWRPTNAVFDGSKVTFDVAPVVPVVGGDANKQPTTSPISLGVFWTAADNAEVYLGQINGVSAAGSVSIPTTKTGGFVRVQTIQTDGTSSQYSALAKVTVSLAAPVVTGPTGGSSGSGGTTIAGTGGPGNTVTVVDTNDSSTVCTATVDSSGDWSCTPSTLLSQGVHSLEATQSDGTNTSPASNTVNFTSDGTPLFASPEVAMGASAVLGFGCVGGLLLMRRRRVGLLSGRSA